MESESPFARPGDPAPGGDEGSLSELIQAFESILQIMPDDVNALGSLAVAYEQAGDTERARDTILTLANLHLDQGDWEQALELTVCQLQRVPHDTDFLRLKVRADDLREAATSGAAGRPEQIDETIVEDPGAAAVGADLHAELELAWLLLEREVITQQEYESAVDALTEGHIRTQGQGDVSLMMELQQLENLNMDRVISFLATESNTPFIEVSCCDIPEDVSGLMPLSTMRQFGVIPFTRVGSEVMVAVLNPMDLALRDRLTSLLGASLHFFLTSADEFQRTLSTLEAGVSAGAN